MINKIKQFIFAGIVMAGLPLLVMAQEESKGKKGEGTRMEALQMELGLTDEQVSQMMELRSSMSPRGKARSEFLEQRDENRAKMQELLTDEQKEKLADLQPSPQRMRAAGQAMMLGLTEVPGQGRGSRFANRGRGRQMRPGSSGFRGRGGTQRNSRGGNNMRGGGPGRGQNSRDHRRGGRRGFGGGR